MDDNRVNTILAQIYVCLVLHDFSQICLATYFTGYFVILQSRTHRGGANNTIK